MQGSRVLVASLCLLAGFACRPSFGSDPVENFYRGKVISIYVGTSEGGLVDEYPRLLSPYLTKYLPGHPTIVVRNMPGASGVNATNFIYSVAPQDGTAYGFVTRGIVYGPMFKMPGATFDPTKLNWVGSPARETSVLTVWSSSTSVKTLADVRHQEVIVGSTAGTAGNMDIFPELLNKFVGTKFKLVRGYKGAPEVTLAMEAGEVQGRGAWSWGALKADHMNWLRDGKIRILVQFGLKKAPDLPDVPLVIDLAKSREDQQLMELICAPISLGYPSFLGPNVPPDRVNAMRQAFQAALRDPDFLAQAKKQRIEIDPVTGEEIAEVVDKMYETPQSVIQQTREILNPD